MRGWSLNKYKQLRSYYGTALMQREQLTCNTFKGLSHQKRQMIPLLVKSFIQFSFHTKLEILLNSNCDCLIYSFIFNAIILYSLIFSWFRVSEVGSYLISTYYEPLFDKNGLIVFNSTLSTIMQWYLGYMLVITQLVSGVHSHICVHALHSLSYNYSCNYKPIQI